MRNPIHYVAQPRQQGKTVAQHTMWDKVKYYVAEFERVWGKPPALLRLTRTVYEEDGWRFVERRLREELGIKIAIEENTDGL